MCKCNVTTTYCHICVCTLLYIQLLMHWNSTLFVCFLGGGKIERVHLLYMTTCNKSTCQVLFKCQVLISAGSPADNIKWLKQSLKTTPSSYKNFFMILLFVASYCIIIRHSKTWIRFHQVISLFSACQKSLEKNSILQRIAFSYNMLIDALAPNTNILIKTCGCSKQILLTI